MLETRRLAPRGDRRSRHTSGRDRAENGRGPHEGWARNPDRRAGRPARRRGGPGGGRRRCRGLVGGPGGRQGHPAGLAEAGLGEPDVRLHRGRAGRAARDPPEERGRQLERQQGHPRQGPARRDADPRVDLEGHRACPRARDARRAATDDEAAQLYVVWPRFPQALRSQIIGYIWDTTAPVGSVFKSQKSGTVTYVVVRSGPADLGKWVTERRDVREDFKRIYGEDARRIPAASPSASTRTTSRAPPSPTWGGSSSASPDGRAEVRRAPPAAPGEDRLGLAPAAAKPSHARQAPVSPPSAARSPQAVTGRTPFGRLARERGRSAARRPRGRRDGGHAGDRAGDRPGLRARGRRGRRERPRRGRRPRSARRDRRHRRPARRGTPPIWAGSPRRGAWSARRSTRSGASTSSSTTRACSSGAPLSRWRSGTGTRSST